MPWLHLDNLRVRLNCYKFVTAAEWPPLFGPGLSWLVSFACPACVGRLSVLCDGLTQYGGHEVNIGPRGNEGRRHDGDIAGGLHMQSAVEQPRLQLGSAHPRGSVAGLDLNAQAAGCAE